MARKTSAGGKRKSHRTRTGGASTESAGSSGNAGRARGGRGKRSLLSKLKFW